jgi:hypothetical protein
MNAAWINLPDHYRCNKMATGKQREQKVASKMRV